MWQAAAAAWRPPLPEEREAAGEARRAELRDFIEIRRALVRGGASSKVNSPVCWKSMHPLTHNTPHQASPLSLTTGTPRRPASQAAAGVGPAARRRPFTIHSSSMR